MGTREGRWQAVYGAAYVNAIGLKWNAAVHAHQIAVTTADGALAAEPEEAEPSLGDDIVVEKVASGVSVYSNGDRTSVLVTRSEAAALARILARFAETGEI